MSGAVLTGPGFTACGRFVVPLFSCPPHPESVASEDLLPGLVASIRAREPQALIAADLFSGAGGLSLGLEQAGFDVLAVDHDQEAIRTFRHHFPGLASTGIWRMRRL